MFHKCHYGIFICFAGSSIPTSNYFTRIEFFTLTKNILKGDLKNIYEKTEEFLSKKKSSNFSLSDEEKEIITDLVKKMRTKWSDCHRSESFFLKKHHDWLQENVELNKKKKAKLKQKKN